MAQLGPCPCCVMGERLCCSDDVREIFEDGVQHRLVMKPQAKIEGITAHDVLSQVLKEVPGPAFEAKQK